MSWTEACKTTATLINTESFVETIKYLHATDECKSGSDLTVVSRSMSRLTLKKFRIPAVTKNTTDGF